jgi:hypothetical protein
MLSNDQGGVDWSGLPLAVNLFCITDIEALINHLVVIKLHKKKD